MSRNDAMNDPANTSKASRRQFVKQVSAGAVATLLTGSKLLQAAETVPEKQPNLLFVCTDQQHWEALGCVDTFFKTPAMDQLAEEGTRFNETYCTTPQCSASRSSLLTGFYPSATGVYNNMDAAAGNPLSQKTIGAHLQEAGYDTAYFGKWHLGDNPTGNAGWDERVIDKSDPKITELGIDYLKRKQNSEKPFALFLMYVNPHDIYHYQPDKSKVDDLPISLPKSWYEDDLSTKPSVQKRFMTHNQGWNLFERDQKYWEEYHAYYRDVVQLVDTQLGQVLSALDQFKLTSSTCRFFTSDHGDMDTHHRLIYKGPFMYDQMVRVPFIASIPEQHRSTEQPQTSDDFMILTDVVPTLLDFAGASVPECDGQSLKPFLTGSGKMPNREAVISQYYGKQNWVNPIRMVRTKKYKYNRYIEHGEELYDLEQDPHEIVNLANDGDYSEVKQELSAQLDAWIKQHQDPFDTFSSNDSARPDPAERRPKDRRT
ncbi:Choline-sulfatase [Polystyrenella longa]|uniref:Choline-sulfatase n=1 Tax=Polystyrenella longa TaxID=2528007 RepID=A0A518CPH1_9PLAN|nr:sulfatase-like hydrolase/transferase [Polystyrenella longa]QDU81094.1 Choline-sulfatase [Polystyrenella longa]